MVGGLSVKFHWFWLVVSVHITATQTKISLHTPTLIKKKGRKRRNKKRKIFMRALSVQIFCHTMSPIEVIALAELKRVLCARLV